MASTFENKLSLPTNFTSKAQEGKEREVTFTEHLQGTGHHTGTLHIEITRFSSFNNLHGIRATAFYK